jgi:hypothetical protein
MKFAKSFALIATIVLSSASIAVAREIPTDSQAKQKLSTDTNICRLTTQGWRCW